MILKGTVNFSVNLTYPPDLLNTVKRVWADNGWGEITDVQAQEILESWVDLIMFLARFPAVPEKSNEIMCGVTE